MMPHAPPDSPGSAVARTLVGVSAARLGNDRVHSMVESVEGSPEDVRMTLLRVSRELERIGVAEGDRDAIEVVLAECMNNVVEHALVECPACPFELKLHLSGENLFCRVEDQGRPMPGLSLPTGDQHDLDVDLQELPEGGFGWFLIRELTRNLQYEHHEGRNSLSFHIRLVDTG